MIKKLAMRYLERRGYTILSPTFTGLAIGYGAAVRRKDDCNRYDVFVTKNDHKVIAINYSVAINEATGFNIP